nr:retrovirus-related Pol polyprotein from transposon TNT 1-94 [Tanacetum cinerariifolium]
MSEPSYKSPMNNYSSVSKGFHLNFTSKLIQSSSNSNSQVVLMFQKDYKAEYKMLKAKLALREASPSNPKTFQPKNKGLVVETFDWDKKEVFDEKEFTQVNILMALADDELTVGKKTQKGAYLVPEQWMLKEYDWCQELSAQICRATRSQGNNNEVSKPITKPLVPDVTQSYIPNQASTNSHPIPLDKWSRDQHIKLVNIIGNLGEGMLKRSMAAKLTAASHSKCLFADFLSEIEPKKVSEPPGFESSKFPDCLCKLDKALYRLKQAPKAWNNGKRNFDVHQPFKFTDFGITELDELGRKRKHMELEPEVKVPGLKCNRSLPEGVPFTNNMVIEEPEYETFFTDVFGDQAFQRWNDI